MNHKIVGGAFPAVIFQMKAGETIKTQSGGMAWMSPDFTMTTQTDGIAQAIGRALFSGEHIFFNYYTANNDGEIAIAAKFPGEIRAIEITPDKPFIIQKTAFLAATSGVELSLHFKKKLSTGLFGGEGFIMQKLSGSGTAFIEMDGSVIDYQLAAGQTMVIDTGYLAAMEATCSMEIEVVKGIKNMIFGGEGFFNTKVTGPGKIYIETMPTFKTLLLSTVLTKRSLSSEAVSNLTNTLFK